MGLDFPGLPARSKKPRSNGLTMVLDKGLSSTQASNVAEIGVDSVDIVKFGWGTSLVTPNLEKKIAIFKNAGIECYFGGTLFEWFIVRDRLEDFLRLVDRYEFTYIEVSNGTIWIDVDEKAALIEKLARNYTVFSEVGSKNPANVMPTETWIRMIKTELQAGASKIICEARESGTVGLFGADGQVKTTMIDAITASVDPSKIMFEAPNKDQQTWFVKKFGTDVNLGNINPWDIIALETIRLGLRSDTFMHFLEPQFQNRFEAVIQQ
jgi:phosphosulfolactate synthase